MKNDIFRIANYFEYKLKTANTESEVLLSKLSSIVDKLEPYVVDYYVDPRRNPASPTIELSRRPDVTGGKSDFPILSSEEFSELVDKAKLLMENTFNGKVSGKLETEKDDFEQKNSIVFLYMS